MAIVGANDQTWERKPPDTPAGEWKKPGLLPSSPGVDRTRSEKGQENRFGYRVRRRRRVKPWARSRRVRSREEA